MSDTVSESIKVFDQLYTDSESNETKPITKSLILFSTFLSFILFFIVLYNKSGSGGFKQLYKKLNK